MYQTLIFISHSKLLYKKRQSRQKDYNDFSKQCMTTVLGMQKSYTDVAVRLGSNVLGPLR